MLRDDLKAARGQWELSLFGCWDLRWRGQPVTLSGREQRLIALLALQGRRPRYYVAGTLWPESTDDRALTSLRVAALRIRQAVFGLLESDRTTIALSPNVNVDVHDLLLCAGEPVGMPAVDTRTTIDLLSGAALLPGWYEDWVVFERERLQHLRLRNLESLAFAALEVGSYDLALTAALEAIAIEPLRESTHAIAIRAHLRAGNRSAAVGLYRTFALRLEEELAIAPSIAMIKMMSPLLVRRSEP